MDATQTRSVLANFGITSFRDAQGELIWSLDIATDHSDGQPCKAYFDKVLRQWKLRDQTITDGAGAAHRPLQYHTSHQGSKRRFAAVPSLDSFDWTDGLPQSYHTDFFRSLDWRATPLGPLDAWQHALRLYTHMLFSDSRAAVVWWGPQRIAIYNQSLLPFIGRLHPMLMGQSFEGAIPDHWDFFRPIFQAMERNEPGVAPNGLEIALERHGYLEETWWDGSLVSLKNDSGFYGGAYFSWIEVTRTVLQDRRAALVNRLSHSSVTSSTSLWRHIYEAFTDSPRDVPLAVIYGADDPSTNPHQFSLKHTLGVVASSVTAPSNVDLSPSDDQDSDTDLAGLFHSARDDTADYMLVDLQGDSMRRLSLDNIDWRGYGQPSRHLVFIPLRVDNVTRGFIMLGLNPRRDFDADHQLFISDLTRQLGSLMTRIAVEERRQRREEYLVKELTDSERRLSMMAEAVPVGIYDLGADGSMRWANTSFFDIMGVASDQRNPATFDWRDHIALEDQANANMEMGRCLMEKVNISDQLRLQRHWSPPGTTNAQAGEPFWVMYSATPDILADGTVGSLLGCMTDISHLKWAEQLQARIADAAEKEKRKQEEFIDITSHEIRNPLSAITQCADSIIASFHDINEKTDVQSLIDIIKMNVEDAESILFCTVHQRRIINDILTLGKLDSGLLTIAPIKFHPRSLVDEALQMFKAEFEANKIDVQITLDDHSVLKSTTSVHGDCARLMQILVNLLTNAIKFTRTEASRNITIRFGSSYGPPESELFGANFHWVPSEKSRPDLTGEADYGTGRVVYLYYCVIDSGKGIPGESANRVFSKFEQADRRTHTKYGGSGLGLFISRELTELQSGHIGVESQEGVGSTFVFYTKAKCDLSPLTSTFTAGHSSASVPELEAQKMENDSLYQTPHKVLQPSLPPNGVNYRVLLVEDNILNQKVLAKQLTKAGCVVYVANDGEEAIKFVLGMRNQQNGVARGSVLDTSTAIDCILMDWEMPVCDGLTATKRIREIESQQHDMQNVIIGITANARPEQLATALDAGMDSILPKPFRVPELLTKIGEQLVSKDR